MVHFDCSGKIEMTQMLLLFQHNHHYIYHETNQSGIRLYDGPVMHSCIALRILQIVYLMKNAHPFLVCSL